MNEVNEEVKVEVKIEPSKQLEKEKRKRGRKPGFKPTQFDRDLLHLLRDGKGNPDELVSQLGIAKSELLERVQLLKNEKFVTNENDAFCLTVNGYNFYTSKAVKKVSLKKAFTGEVKLRKQKKVERKEPEAQVPEQKHVNDFLSSTEVVDLGGKLGKMDLQEIIQRYGPTPEQKTRFLQQKAGEVLRFAKPKISSALPTPTQQSVSLASETCDLCKSDFKVSISNLELAKYGHCFCGAAYHKECYDSLLSDSAKCIRCGKKLFLIIDKQSREAIKGIRDVFE